MIFGSLCSGIEAASVAFKPLGWKAAFFSEIEKFPNRVLAHHYPDVPNHGDMTKFKEWPDHAIRLLCGGTPCQSFSVAGLRKGLDDSRGNLMLTFGEIAARYRPQWLVWENVPGVLSSNKGRDFAAFLGLVSGQEVSVPRDGWQSFGIIPGYKNAYGIAYRVFDAQYFGLAQRRRRVFVVGYLGDWRPAAAVLLEQESLCGHPPPRREKGQEVTPTIRAGAANGGKGHSARSGDSKDELIVPTTGALCARTGLSISSQDAANGHLVTWPADVTPTLDAHYGDKMGLENQHINAGGGCSSIARCLTGSNQRIDAETETLIPCQGGFFDVAQTLKGEGFDASEDGTGRQNLIPTVAGTMISRSKSGGFSNSIDHAAAAYMVPVAFAQNTRDEVREMPYVGALAANAGMKQTSYIRNAMAVRRLTPEECEALQGFPRGYTNVQDAKGKPAADGPRYKALGNSWAVPNVAWIGRRIQMMEDLLNND